jgi:hypothetical protein
MGQDASIEVATSGSSLKFRKVVMEQLLQVVVLPFIAK